MKKNYSAFKLKILFGMVLLAFITCVSSCQHNKHFIYYKYKGVTITRCYEDAESRFYYGYYTKGDELPDDYIFGKYPGRDGLMEGILVFVPDGRVEIEQLNSIYVSGHPKYLWLRARDYLDRSDFLKNAKSKENVVRVHSALNVEKELNSKSSSKVLVLY